MSSLRIAVPIGLSIVVVLPFLGISALPKLDEEDHWCDGWQAIAAACRDFLIGKEARYRLNLEIRENLKILVTQLVEFTGAVDLRPLYRATASRLVAADVAEVRLTIERHVPRRRRRNLALRDIIPGRLTGRHC